LPQHICWVRQLYFWDNAGYWRTAALSALFFSDPAGLIRRTVESVFTNDYNYLPVIIPAAVMSVFGTSRIAFVLAIVNFYVVPFWAAMYVAVHDSPVSRSARSRCRSYPISR
jgi:hypothetical protein